MRLFGLDLAVDGVLDQFCDWIYGKLISFFGDFFSMINMMGAELFDEIVAIANGKLTKAEAYGFSDIAVDHVCRFV